MFKEELPHFVTGPFKPQNVFLEDREYGLALDCLVKACTDLLILDNEDEDCHILLGKRIVEPQPDWWFMGGRMKPGDTPATSLVRLMKRELGLQIPPEKFQPLGVHSYAWARRQQPPMDNGTCDISAVFTLVLPRSTVESVKFDDKEYSDMRWFTVDEIISGDFHPALKASAKDLRTRFAWRKLSQLIDTEDANSIAEAAVHLVKSTKL